MVGDVEVYPGDVRPGMIPATQPPSLDLWFEDFFNGFCPGLQRSSKKRSAASSQTGNLQWLQWLLRQGFGVNVALGGWGPFVPLWFESPRMFFAIRIFPQQKTPRFEAPNAAANDSDKASSVPDFKTQTSQYIW